MFYFAIIVFTFLEKLFFILRFNYRWALIFVFLLGLVVLCVYRFVWTPQEEEGFKAFLSRFFVLEKKGRNHKGFSKKPINPSAHVHSPDSSAKVEPSTPRNHPIGAPQIKSCENFKKAQRIIPLVMNLVKKKYVESISEEEMIEGAIQGICSILDPHCMYFNGSDLEEFFNKTRGSFAGVGLELMMEGGLLKVVNTMEDTPAYEAGLQGKDIILAIDGTLVQGLSMVEALKKIKGKEGTTVELTVKKPNESQPIQFKVLRKSIGVRSIKWGLKDGFGYVRITVFDQNTCSFFIEALKLMKERLGFPLRGLIVDVRNNSGGLLSQAVQVSNLFIDKGIIVSGQGRTKGADFKYTAKKENALKETIPVVVLINENSASAAEIFAAALQDHKKALVVGSHSFGKGSVQEMVSLGNHLGGVKLTVSLFYRPNGDPIQGRGIEPNVVIEPFLIQEREGGVFFRESNLPKTLLPKPLKESGEESQKKEGHSQEESLSQEKQATSQAPQEDLGKEVKTLGVSQKRNGGALPKDFFEAKQKDYQLEVAFKLVQALSLWHNNPQFSRVSGLKSKVLLKKSSSLEK